VSRANARRLPVSALALGVLAGVVVVVVVHSARDGDYWNYSEGVYALTARQLLNGDALYRDVVGAQPPWQFIIGAAILGVHDSLGFLRAMLGIAQLATGVLSAIAVWRLTTSRAATALAPALTLLTPWAVHEHGTLTPELVVTPMLMAAALLTTRPDRVAAGVVIGALAPFVKWQYVIALVPLIVFSVEPRTALRWAVAALCVQAAAFTALFGGDLWKDTVVAQLHTGAPRSLSVLVGVWGQAVWNVIGLLALALIAWVRRCDSADPRLTRMLAALAVVEAFTLLTIYKEGTGLAALIPLESTLVPLALAGAVYLFRARGTMALVASAVLLAFTSAQSVSLLTSDETGFPFVDPVSERGAWHREASGDEIERLVAAARACPPGVPYTGVPFVAFLAHRPMPANQPDQFLPSHSSTLHDVLAEMDADQPRCP
jgi:hypothetical protein